MVLRRSIRKKTKYTPKIFLSLVVAKKDWIFEFQTVSHTNLFSAMSLYLFDKVTVTGDHKDIITRWDQGKCLEKV